MAKDWIEKGRPYKVVFSNYGIEKNEFKVCLAFYWDKRKSNAWREQEIFPLCHYRSDDAQEGLLLASMSDFAGAELDVDEDTGAVERNGFYIGKIPKKILQRIDEEGFYDLFGEELQQEDGFVPTVRIFW